MATIKPSFSVVVAATFTLFKLILASFAIFSFFLPSTSV